MSSIEEQSRCDPKSIAVLTVDVFNVAACQRVAPALTPKKDLLVASKRSRFRVFIKIYL